MQGPHSHNVFITESSLVHLSLISSSSVEIVKGGLSQSLGQEPELIAGVTNEGFQFRGFIGWQRAQPEAEVCKEHWLNRRIGVTGCMYFFFFNMEKVVDTLPTLKHVKPQWIDGSHHDVE